MHSYMFQVCVLVPLVCVFSLFRASEWRRAGWSRWRVTMKLNFSITRWVPGRYISVCMTMISWSWSHKYDVRADALRLAVFTDTPPPGVSDLRSCRGTSQTTRAELSQVLNMNMNPLLVPFLMIHIIFSSSFSIISLSRKVLCVWREKAALLTEVRLMERQAQNHFQHFLQLKVLKLPQTITVIHLLAHLLISLYFCQGVSCVERSSNICSAQTPPAGGSSSQGSKVHKSR